jgi:hypothetical protein
MSLFQNSVLNKYLKGLESEKVNEAYERFTSHFHNPTIQENIRNSKEEQYQGEFLIDLFVNVFGYVKNPTPDFNLTTELKNIKGSKKTDGAILKGEKALAVIELKGTNTTDLSKVETQAFGYKNNQPGCNYVITSNFEKLRFYIDNAVDFEEFNLFQLTKERFEILWLCLSSEYLLKDIPKKIKDESLTQEENITKKLYKDYASFRNEIFDAIQNENPEYDKLTLFKKTQKLLDRFLFIFFAEDRLLLPPNSIRSIVNQWTDLKDKYDEYFPLYDRFKKYFGYMNTGHKGQQHDIFAYNGGLFSPDEILDNIKINDDLLHKHTVNLSNYDFESEVSVNILGHIFEHSLNDIDEIQAEIQGIETEQNKTKRKKDGVFYTPKYITKYIVDNTVGKLCEEKKIELDIQEAEYEKERKGRKKATLKNLTQKLEDYRKWLLQITICDPACGSGAFLNQALEFLIAEHQYIDELQAKLFGDAMILSEVENSILENNLFGVDINEESVEIAKLSLWLRTAQKGRKLTSLNSNIKCGNSLIDDPNVAGDRAFNWQNEFPGVFAKGGFDVIIGNPPYVRVEFISEEHVQFYKSNFTSSSGKFDLSSVFYEKSISLLNQHGIYSIITSYQFIYTTSGIGLRKFIAKNTETEIIMFSSDSQVFKDATTYAGIFISVKSSNPSILITNANNEFSQVNTLNFFKLELDNFCSKKVIVSDTSLLRRIEGLSGVKYGKEIGNAKTGVVTSSDEVFYLTKEQVLDLKLEEELIYPILGPNELHKWHLAIPETYCLYPYKEIDGKTTLIDIDTLKSKYPNVFKYLNDKKAILVSRSQGRRDYSNSSKWYQLNRPREKWIYDSIKIIYPGTTNTTKFAFDDRRQLFRNARVYAYLLNEENFELYHTILPILNSSFCKYLIFLKCPPKANNYYEMSTGFMENFPFIIPDNNSNFINKSKHCIETKKTFLNQIDKFLTLIIGKFGVLNVTKKLQNWHELASGEFLKELEKAHKKSAKENDKIYNKLSLSEEAEWMQYFNEQKQKAKELKSDIDKTDREIDQMVYELYGLTDNEIKIVEEAIA